MTSKRRWSTMTKEQVAEEMDPLHRALVDDGVYRSCLTCDNRRPLDNQATTLKCGLGDAVPPVEVLVFGCNSWIYMPF